MLREPTKARATSEQFAVLQRVAVIGASATDGYFAMLERVADDDRPLPTRKMNLAEVLDASITAPHQTIAGASSSLFFLDPQGTGKQVLNDALAANPTLIVAIDYLFWFGYGSLAADGTPIRSESDRLELLEEGLRFLEPIEVPLVLGDFPDMSRAVGGMLNARQMPKRETLAQLSARLREWAAERPNVIIIPLARLVADMQGDLEITIGDYRWPPGSKPLLLQNDELHPTATGLIAMAQLVAAGLHDHGIVDAKHAFAQDPNVVLKRLSGRPLPSFSE